MNSCWITFTGNLSYLSNLEFVLCLNRKPSYTSSRSSRCWSFPWDTKRRSWRPRWCRSARNALAKDVFRRPRKQRRTRTRPSRDWPRPARPRSRACGSASPNRPRCPWWGTAATLRAPACPIPPGSPSRLLQRRQRLLLSRPAAGCRDAPTWGSTRVHRPGRPCAASSATGGTSFCWRESRKRSPYNNVEQLCEENHAEVVFMLCIQTQIYSQFVNVSYNEQLFTAIINVNL